jgi:hypothetical protein
MMMMIKMVMMTMVSKSDKRLCVRPALAAFLHITTGPTMIMMMMTMTMVNIGDNDDHNDNDVYLDR